jgi:2-polyprenyl-3-methyl-5-hydroxy-6-metoxy-1,4-benzoquinol methylase
LIDDLYAEPYGRGVLNNLTGTPQYLSWLAQKLRPHVGDEVLEVNAGIGNLAGRLMSRRTLYVAAEIDPLHLHALRNRFLRTPNVAVQRIDPSSPGDLAGLENCFDTVLCLNVLEQLEDPAAVLDSLNATIRPGGSLLVLAPNVLGVYGSLDRKMGHKRRFTGAELAKLLEASGFDVERVETFNKVALLPWWAYGRLLHAGNISKLVLKIFDKSVWLWRRLDVLLPWPGLSLLAVGRKPVTPGAIDSGANRRETTQNAR